MVTRFRSLASAVVLASAVLFLGPSTSRVDAEHFRAPERHAGGNHHGNGGQVRHGKSYWNGGGHGSYGHGSYRPYSRHGYRPYYGSYPGYYGGGYPAYRVVRVFVAFPYPHWIYQRVCR